MSTNSISENETLVLTAEQVPPSFACCFQSDCPLSSECIRFHSGEVLRDKQDCGFAVYPSARRGDSCTCFVRRRVILAAYGFKNLLGEVKKKDSAFIHKAVEHFLGGRGTFYRYHHGERLLTPEQQESILKIFRKKGYTENLVFDEYVRAYDFSAS